MQIKDGLVRHEDTTIPLNQISSTNIKSETVERRYDSADPEELEVIEGLMKKDSRKSLILILLTCFILIGFLLLPIWLWWNFIRNKTLEERYNSSTWEYLVKAKYTKHEERYYLEIQMTSGSNSLFWSVDKDFVRKVNDVLVEALSNSGDKAINYNINIEKQEVIDNSVKHITQNFNYEIDASQHHGMTPEDLKFFTGELAVSIRELGSQINSIGNQELQASLQELVDVMNSGKAQPSVVHSTFEKLKKATEAYDVYDSVCGMFGLVSRAATVLSVA